MFMAAPAKSILPSHGQILGDGDDGIEVLAVNGSGGFDLPHSRSDCTKHKFNPTEAIQYHSSSLPLSTLANAKHCDKCYCYVCDVLASKCIEWRTHCHGECIFSVPPSFDFHPFSYLSSSFLWLHGHTHTYIYIYIYIYIQLLIAIPSGWPHERRRNVHQQRRRQRDGCPFLLPLLQAQGHPPHPLPRHPPLRLRLYLVHSLSLGRSIREKNLHNCVQILLGKRCTMR